MLYVFERGVSGRGGGVLILPLSAHVRLANLIPPTGLQSCFTFQFASNIVLYKVTIQDLRNYLTIILLLQKQN